MSINASLTARSGVGKRKPTRERLVETGAALFQRQGYNGTGLIQLLEESGAPKGSFYYHFPGGKEELAEAAVQQAGAGIVAMIDKAFAPVERFADGAARMGKAIADWFEASGYGEGCPITSVLLETVPGSARLTEACRGTFQSWIEAVRGHALRLGEDEQAAKLLSTGLVLAIEGAWVVARAQRSCEPFHVAVRLVVIAAGRGA